MCSPILGFVRSKIRIASKVIILLAALTANTYGQALQNGVYATPPNSTFVPTFQVPAGMPLLIVSLRSWKTYTISDNLAIGVPVTIYATLNGTLPSASNYQYKQQVLAPQLGEALRIVNPPAGNYWFRVFASTPSIYYVGSYEIGAFLPPVISQHPSGASVLTGASVTFTVKAGGPDLTYQWSKNGKNISGATGTSYSINGAEAADAGTYSVLVKNPGGTATSSDAALAVQAPPVPPAITSQPQNTAVMPGATATFTVVAAGATPLTYQWMKNGATISGATSAILTLQSVSLNHAGTYSVKVANSAGNITSSGAVLRIGPSISSQPSDATINPGGSAFFSISASGSAPLTFQWHFNGNAMSDQTGQTLALNNVQAANAGGYSVKVSNAAGSASSRTATLSISVPAAPPVITEQPQPYLATEGESVTLKVIATGAASYRWSFQATAGAPGTEVPGGTAATFSLAEVSAANAGYYSVKVLNSSGSISSTPALVTVSPEPKIVVQPQSKAVPPGTNVTFNVKALGRLPLSYQWYAGEQAVPGATEASLSLPNVTLEQSGDSYTVMVSNFAGSVRSDSGHLTVSAALADLGTKLWSLDLPTREPPAFGPDGTLYLTSSTNTFAISPLGKTNWNMPSRILRAVGPGGEAYLIKPRPGGDAERTRVSAVSSSGSLLWSYHLRDASDLYASHADVDQIALRGDGILACYGSTIGFSLKRNALYSGENLISETFEVVRFPKPYQAIGKSFGFVGEDDTTFVVYRSGQILVIGYMTAMNPDGSPYWTIHFEIAYPALNSKGEILFEKNGTYLSCYAPSGIKLWERIGTGKIAIALEERIMIGSTGKLICLNPDGSLGWEAAPNDIETSDPLSTPAIASDGTIYFTARFSLYAYDSNGAFLWQFSTREPVLSAPTIGSNGVVYFSTNKKLYAVKGLAPLAASSWPVEGGNPRRTFRGTRPPAFKTVPKSASVSFGDAATFTATANGTPPLSFQWRFQGTNIIGGENGTLTLNNVSFDNAGEYEVDAFNAETGLLARTNVQLSVVIPEATIALSGLPSTGGSVTGAGTFPDGSSHTVTGVPNAGYSFGNWTENGNVVSTSSIYAFTLNGKRTLIANFIADPILYTVSASASPAIGGIISGTGTFVAGSSRTLIATPNSGYTFANWMENGNVVSTSSGYTFSLQGNRTIVANFTADPVNYTVTLSVSPSEGGTVSGGGNFASGTARTVAATSNNGYTFANWTENGGVVSTSSTFTFSVNANRNLIANFSPGNPPDITIQPLSQTVLPGSAVTFAVGAGGSGLSFEWRKDGVTIPGAVASTYTIQSAQLSDGGNYTVIVRNAIDSVMSEAAALLFKEETPAFLPAYRFLLRIDERDGVDVASFEDAAFLATLGAPNAVRDDVELFNLDSTNGFAPRITSFPKSPQGLSAPVINFPDFRIAGLQNLISPDSTAGSYESVYGHRWSGPSGGGTFTLGKADYRDFDPPVPGDPIAYEWPLVFCQVPARGGPATAIYNLLETENGMAKRVCELSHLVAGGVLDIFDERVLLLAGPRITDGEPAQLVTFDPIAETCKVVYEFSDGGTSARISMGNDVSPDGYAFGTFANSQDGAGYIWRVRSDGSLFQKIYSFPQKYVQPRSIALGKDGYLYGVSSGGGIENRGMIFRLKLDGSEFQVRWEFRQAESKGAFAFRILRDEQRSDTAFLVVARNDDGNGIFGSPTECGRCFTVGQYLEPPASSVQPPSLTASRSVPGSGMGKAGDLLFTWTDTLGLSALETSVTVAIPQWVPYLGTIQRSGNVNWFTLTPLEKQRFFRLRQGTQTNNVPPSNTSPPVISSTFLSFSGKALSTSQPSKRLSIYRAPDYRASLSSTNDWIHWRLLGTSAPDADGWVQDDYDVYLDLTALVDGYSSGNIVVHGPEKRVTVAANLLWATVSGELSGNWTKRVNGVVKSGPLAGTLAGWLMFDPVETDNSLASKARCTLWINWIRSSPVFSPEIATDFGATKPDHFVFDLASTQCIRGCDSGGYQNNAFTTFWSFQTSDESVQINASFNFTVDPF